MRRDMTVILSVLAVFAGVLVFEAGHAWAKPPLKGAIARQQHRNDYTRFETIIDGLGITAGMSILDIGSGPGYASFLFAERMGGSGEVFATDIRKDFVEHIAAEAQKRRLNNLHSAVVSDKGLDQFYSRHRYDLVFLSNVYHCIDKPIEFFTGLRKFLKPNARLVFVLYNQVPFFTEDDLSDVEALAGTLLKEPSDSPFLTHLSPETRQLLRDRTRNDQLEHALVDDLNAMLADPIFYKGFYKNFYFTKGFFEESERDLANWLIMTLREDGSLDRPLDQLAPRSIRSVMKLNHLFIARKFGRYFNKNGLGAYIPAGDANRHTSKYAVVKELNEAGYSLIKDFAVSPYYDAVIVGPKEP